MNKKYSCVIYYRKTNRYSFNHILSAIEIHLERIEKFYDFFITKEISLKALNELSQKYKRIVLLISILTPEMWEIKKLINQLKNHIENLTVIAGGPHITGISEKSIEDMQIDYGVLYEGEETIIELLEYIYLGKSLKNVKGIVFREKEETIKTPRKKPVDTNKYKSISERFKKFGPIEITRGCNFVCRYCETPFIFGGKLRHKSIDNILKEVIILKKYGKTDIRFITPNAMAYGGDGKNIEIEKIKTLLKEIRNIIKNEGRIFIGTFPSEIRPEHITEESLNIIKTYANNDNLVIGAQSGSERILERIHRGHSVKDVINAVKLGIKFGFKINVDFIFGFPYETEEDLKDTLSLMKEITNLGGRIHAHFFMPLPKTPMEKLKPKIPPKSFLIEIENLISKGKLYGEWKKQMEVSFKIHKYLINQSSKTTSFTQVYVK